MPYWEVDRALWAYGKHLKQAQKIGDSSGQHLGDNEPVLNSRHGWVHSQTFGGKAKSFWWKSDEGYNIHVMRDFNGVKGSVSINVTISPADTEQLNNYMAKNEWVPLANNVEKLHNGTEKQGIGQFLHEQLGWSIVNSQLASQLGVIFSLSGAWEYNGKKKGIEFRQLSKGWRSCVSNYYHDQELPKYT